MERRRIALATCVLFPSSSLNYYFAFIYCVRVRSICASPLKLKVITVFQGTDIKKVNCSLIETLLPLFELPVIKRFASIAGEDFAPGTIFSILAVLIETSLF